MRPRCPEVADEAATVAAIVRRIVVVNGGAAVAEAEGPDGIGSDNHAIIWSLPTSASAVSKCRRAEAVVVAFIFLIICYFRFK